MVQVFVDSNIGFKIAWEFLKGFWYIPIVLFVAWFFVGFLSQKPLWQNWAMVCAQLKCLASVVLCFTSASFWALTICKVEIETARARRRKTYPEQPGSNGWKKERKKESKSCLFASFTSPIKLQPVKPSSTSRPWRATTISSAVHRHPGALLCCMSFS